MGMRTAAQFVVRLFSLLDAVLVAAVLAFTWTLDFQRPFPDFLFVLMIVPFWRWFYAFFGLYESHRLEGLFGLTRKVLSAHFLGAFVLALSIKVFALPFHTLSVFRFAALTTAVVILPKWIVYGILQFLRERGHDKHNVCVIGGWEKAEEVARRFAESPAWGLQLALVGTGPSEKRKFFTYPDRTPISGPLYDVLTNEVVDEIFIAVPVEELAKEESTVQICREFGLESRILLSLASDVNGSRGEDFSRPVGIPVSGKSSGDSHLGLKRALDLVFGLALLILVSPLMLLLAIVVKLSSPGPVLFRQKRVGLHGRKFVMYKFRTMVNGAEALVHTLSHRSVMRGPVFKTPQDWRVTNFGRLMRRFSLDELPQLMNVIKGDMSLVGPRPLPLHESAAITGEHRRRFAMRPGLTCLWQVNGRNLVEFQKWMMYDLEYVDNWSLWLDAKLLLRTIPVVLSGKGAY
jgi:exopolysaccharide biosynthesis polyprenyl glycosylphosphotransferase